jgi:hypothetical protein
MHRPGIDAPLISSQVGACSGGAVVGVTVVVGGEEVVVVVGAGFVVVDVMRVVELSSGPLVVSGRSASPFEPLTPQPAISRAPKNVLTATLFRLRSTVAPRSVAPRPYGLSGRAASEIETTIEL